MRFVRLQYMSIVITGNPGVGKHTISKEVAKNLELDILDINKIAKDEGLFEKNQDTNDIDTKKLEKIFSEKNLEKNVFRKKFGKKCYCGSFSTIYFRFTTSKDNDCIKKKSI